MEQDESVGVRTCFLQELCSLSEPLMAVRGAQCSCISSCFWWCERVQVNAGSPVTQPLLCCLQHKQRLRQELLSSGFVGSSCSVYEHDVMYCGVCDPRIICSFHRMRDACWGEI